MSKQPCVWVVEYRNAPWPWELWSHHKTRDAAFLHRDCLVGAYKNGEFRVAKYVRVEPKKKRSKP